MKEFKQAGSFSVKLPKIGALLIPAACLVFTPLMLGECLTVTSGSTPGPFQSSSQKVRITAMLDGKPLKDAVVSFFLITKENKSALHLATDAQGVVTAPPLKPGQYQVVAARAPGSPLSAALYLDVSTSVRNVTSMFLVDLTPKPPTPAELKDLAALAEKTPVTEQIREFVGVVEDQSGAMVPEANIQILRKGYEGAAITLRSDEAGHFSASLAQGTYVVFVRSPGFRTEIKGIEVRPGAEPKSLRILLRVFEC